MKKGFLVLVFLTFFASACNLPGGSVMTQTASPGKSTSPCGDGVCSEPENAQNCPADCPSTALGTGPSTAGGTSEPAAAHQGDASLYMTTMTHMEQGFTDDKEQGVFLNHVEELRYGMDLADAYEAKLTIESEQPFAKANAKWNLNIMAEILQRGHGVGTHCDFGFRDDLMPVEQYAQNFRENKELVDALVGAENNLGCSGGGGANDWAVAASMAGFEYLDGVVGMHYLAMPLENRPDSTWTDDFIRTEGYHMNAPVDLYQRIYLFGVANAQDFVADETPVIVVSSGEMGPLAGMAEGVGEIGGRNCRPECALASADVDALVAKILDINQNRDRSRVAKLTVYLPANIFVSKNEPALRYFFSQMQALAQQGVITWATQKQVYEAYVAWNQ
jgi:hypothetical protein